MAFDLSRATKKLGELARKYRYPALIGLLGLVLLIWPFGRRTTTAKEVETGSDISSAPVNSQEAAASPSQELEARLTALLGQMEGVGTVQCVLTTETGTRREYLKDTRLDGSGGEVMDETVVLDAADGAQQALVVQETYPSYRGAVVVCSGADSAVVRLAVTQAVSALTGLGADRITVMQADP